jgi:hypothetical protein
MEQTDMLGGPARSSKDVDLDEQDAVVSSHLAKLRELASALQTSSGAQMATHHTQRLSMGFHRWGAAGQCCIDSMQDAAKQQS